MIMRVVKFVLFMSCLNYVSLLPIKQSRSSVGCVNCHRTYEDRLNVHLVPHSHDDVGWLKTVDQYFYGLNNSIQIAGVQYIISSVVQALLENPDRRFIQVETAYFWKWWNTQSKHIKNQFKNLVDKGQIEIVNGAWSMNDEACTNYQSTIDQFTLGLKIINDTLGECGRPRVGWQIDPFGHSKEQASIFKQMGFEAVFFSRIDWNDRIERKKNKSLELIWQSSSNLGNSDIFTGIFPINYAAPKGFCFDVVCDDDPIIDDPESPYYNLASKVKLFKSQVEEYASFYRTNNVLITMGEDFNFQDAQRNYINIDRLIKGFENDSSINIIYSTPSCYLQAVNKAKPVLPVKNSDFFPYSSGLHDYWTGYFTSRPNSKRFERVGHGLLQSAKQLVAVNNFNNSEYYLKFLNEAMGTMQHHDAITGTEKQHVTRDYVRQLTRGIKQLEKPLGRIVSKIFKKDNESDINIKLSTCLLSNISICPISQSSDSFVVAIYNPLSWIVTHYVRLPVENVVYEITGPDGLEEYDIIPTLSKFEYVNLTEGKPSQHELVFAARNIPPMGIKYYKVATSNKICEEIYEPVRPPFQIDLETNLISSVTLNNITLRVNQNFYYYESHSNSSPVSGAYIFRPNRTAPKDLKGNVTKLREFSGRLVYEFHQKWNDENVDILQCIRWYRNENYIEFDWIVGNIKTDNITGKEVITRYTSKLDSGGKFYTDSNGREMLERKKNSRPDYTYNSTLDPVASNYYPVTSKIVIKDLKRNLELAVLNDRSQGGTSLHNGQIELMLHRRLMKDDKKGVRECLNETEFGRGVYVRGSHFLLLGKANGKNPDGRSTAVQERILAQKKLLQPFELMVKIKLSSEGYQNRVELVHSALTRPLQENVNILSFEPWKNNSYLLRLEHIFENNDDPDNSNAVSNVDLTNLFNDFKLENVKETTLAANEWLADYRAREKYSWITSPIQKRSSKSLEHNSDTIISLKPMQIRTFVIKLKPK